MFENTPRNVAVLDCLPVIDHNLARVCNLRGEKTESEKLLPSAAVSAALPRGHAALAFVDVAVGFADRAAAVVAVGFLRIYGFYISASV